MTWDISHGGSRNGYSYSGMAEFISHLKRYASWTQKRPLRPLLVRRSGDPFSIAPRDARKIGLELLAVAPRLPVTTTDDWGAMARQIGQSAIRAADAGEPWRRS